MLRVRRIRSARAGAMPAARGRRRAPPACRAGWTGARYFDPHDAAQMASVIQTVLADQDLRHECGAWEWRSGKLFLGTHLARTLAVYQRVLGLRPSST